MKPWAVFGLLIAACTGGSPDARGTGEPTGPTGPTDPTEPAEPTEPTEPTGPTEPADRPLLPLEVGAWWDYDVVRGSRPGCPGALTVEIVDEDVDPADGLPFFVREYSCGSYAVTDLKVDGDTVWIRMHAYGPWTRLLVLPPVEGATFLTGGGVPSEFRWTAEPTITVPAGTFTDCWRREATDTQEDWDVYCPGVGWVSSDHNAWIDEGYDLVDASTL